MVRFLPMTCAIALTGMSALAGCATATPPVASGTCNHEALTRFVGQKASAESGAALLRESGARTLRWGGPGMAMTMDFRPDRLTVSYDAAMVITAARCG